MRSRYINSQALSSQHYDYLLICTFLYVFPRLFETISKETFGSGLDSGKRKDK